MNETRAEQIADEIMVGLRDEIRGILITVSDPAKRPDFGQVEFLIRRLLLGKAREVMQIVVESVGTGYEGAHKTCTCGGVLKFIGYSGKYINTILGEISLKRAYYYCKRCGKSRFPLDRVLSMGRGHTSPGLRRVVSLAGITGSFYGAPKLLEEVGEIKVSAKAVQRITEEEAVSAGVTKGMEEILPSLENSKRAYISCDGAMVNTTKGWREIKVGVIYNDAKERKRYVSLIGGPKKFGAVLRSAGVRVGVFKCEEKIFIGDGAQWIRNQARINFPQAVQIVDFYHVKEHITECAKKLFREGTVKMKRWRKRSISVIYKGGAGKLIPLLAKSGDKNKKAVKELLKYLIPNAGRMRYPEYKKNGWQIGSGPVESACKQIVSQRLKLNAGMRWRVENADAIGRLRCIWLSGAWDTFYSRVSA